MMNKVNIMIVGVGGQGNLLASEIIGGIAMKNSYDVKMSEVHGMAQRGGSVVTGVKFGAKVNSPLIEKGEADIILAFEKLEAYRAAEYLKPGGEILINNQQIDPMPVIIGQSEYPENIIEKIKNKYKNVQALKALDIARECGNKRVVNTVMLGLLANYLEFDKNDWVNTIKERVPEEFEDINLKAFEQGYQSLV